MQTKTCKTCLQVLPVSDFYKQTKRMASGAPSHYSSCRECYKAKERARSHANRQAKAKNQSGMTPAAGVRVPAKKKRANLPSCPEWEDTSYIDFESRYEEAMAQIPLSVPRSEAKLIAARVALAAAVKATP